MSTTFRRKVRLWVAGPPLEMPLEDVQLLIRAAANDKKHSIIESTWKDQTGEVGYDFVRNRTSRMVSVRYVTGGMRHGLAPSLDWGHAPAFVEFTRTHANGKTIRP